MKSIYYLVAVVIASIFTSGCGDDRSHGTYELSTRGKATQWIYDTPRGEVMVEKNFVYIPGGFDADDDGLNDGGFWLAKYEAKDDNTTNLAIDTSNINNVQTLLEKYFRVYDKNGKYKKFNARLSPSSGFTTTGVSSIEGLDVSRVIFTEKGKTVKSVSPLEAVISLQNSQIKAGYGILLPSQKQWMHLVKLVINNPKNWTGKEVGKGKLYQGNKYGTHDRRSFVIENSLLGVDKYVPKNYQVDVYDLSGSVAEWTSGMVKKEDRFLTGDSGRVEYQDVNNAPLWWKPILKNQQYSLSSMEGAGLYHDGFSRAGTNDTLKVKSSGETGNVDDYAVIARGGSNSIDDKTLVGISASKLSYGVGYKGPTVGFRAASDYLY